MFKRFIAGAALAASTMFAQEAGAKGIFVTGGGNNGGGSNNQPRPAVKYSVQLARAGDGMRPVAVSHRFQTGDRFRFLFESSQDCYVYLMHRQLHGNPDSMERYVGSKGIITVRDDDNSGRSSGNYTLLYPQSGSIKLTARQAQQVPARDSFELDTDTGIEKIVMVVSPTPIDVRRLFNVQNGAPSNQGNNGGNAGRKPRNDSEDDVMGQLRKEIESLSANSTSEHETNSKGICVGDCNSYSAPRNPQKPFLVTIDLRHYRQAN